MPNHKKVLETLKKRYKAAVDGWSSIYADALDDDNFLGGEQWVPKDKQDRESVDKPCLVINKLPNFVNHVVNAQRNARPALSIKPISGEASIDVASIYDGIIKSIERNSSASVARNEAYHDAVATSVGFYKIGTQDAIESEDPFEVEIITEQIKNQFSVLIDPQTEKIDGSDMRFAFITSEMTLDEFKEEFPSADPSSFEDDSVGQEWKIDDGVKIVEYYTKNKENKQKIYQAQDGTVLTEEQIPEGLDKSTLKQKYIFDTVIRWYKATASEILEETIIPGIYIPILPIFGPSYRFENKDKRSSLIRWAKDPQRMYNYWKSVITEKAMAAPKTPWIGVEGQFDRHEDEWSSANIDDLPYLEYSAVTIDGKLAPAPQRVAPVPIEGALIAASKDAAEDIKATTGIYDASLGVKSNETSGKAIIARQQEGENANFHFVDVLNACIKQEGRIYLGMIPEIYDTNRIITIIDKEDKEKLVELNKVDNDGKILNNLGNGKYVVSLDVGASFNTRRAEAAGNMLEFMRLYPASGEVIGDLVAKNMDFPGSEELSTRLKNMIPPNIIDKQQSNEVQQIQQTQEQLKAVTLDLEKILKKNQELAKENEDLQEKADKNEADLKKAIIDSKTRIAVAKINTSDQ